jgi:hypothetical protein
LALGDSYAALAELKTRLGGVTGSTYDTPLTEALSAASREIEKCTGRQFNKASSASARVYVPRMEERLEVDDFYTTTGLIVATDTAANGSYSTTWATTDYQLEPLNGVVDGETGWPYFEIVGVGNYGFPLGARTAAVRITAAWGWNAVPAPIKEATLIAAEALFKRKDAPFGVAGANELGFSIRLREDPYVSKLIEPYRRWTPLA